MYNGTYLIGGGVFIFGLDSVFIRILFILLLLYTSKPVARLATNACRMKTDQNDCNNRQVQRPS